MILNKYSNTKHHNRIRYNGVIYTIKDILCQRKYYCNHGLRQPQENHEEIHVHMSSVSGTNFYTLVRYHT